VLFSEFGQNEDEMQRFIKAMKQVMPIQHFNLVEILGAGKSGTHCWVAMELIEGPSLAQMIKRKGPTPAPDWKVAWHLAIDVGQALAFAHEHDAVHGCVYPENILIQHSDQRTKLSDLMLARILESATAHEIAQPGKKEANLVYMSPERTHGLKKIDARSDLYSLGACLYAYLTGRPPVTGETLLEKITRVRQSCPSRPSQFTKGMPPRFEALVMKLLAKSPDERYQSADELVNDLESIG
jgi:serine/threonine-protein kinase